MAITSSKYLERKLMKSSAYSFLKNRQFNHFYSTKLNKRKFCAVLESPKVIPTQKKSDANFH